jgi:hypothetical protein
MNGVLRKKDTESPSNMHQKIFMDLGYIVKGFLVIVSFLRFQWAQTLIVITLGFKLERSLIKKGKNK